MISSEVQRTLVKSPPELWSELSDPAALARHLGELGEIRIVRVEGEKTVEWVAENTTGTVSIQPSGWGTKVTLSVNREIVAPQPAALDEPEPGTEAALEVEPDPVAGPQPEVEPEPEVEPDPVAGPQPEVEPEPEVEPDPVAGPEPEVEPEPEPEPERRRGFFARLFGRGRRGQSARAETLESAPTSEPWSSLEHAPAEEPPVAEEQSGAQRPEDGAEAIELESATAPDAFAAVRQALADEGLFGPADPPMAELEREPDDRIPAVADISAELRAAEEAATAEVTAVLAAVLDRLGAAHHRPFSRS
jgi:hypothetical protein